MAGLLASGDQQRKIRNRNIFLVAFALLIILWTVKLSSYPQQTLLGAFTSDAPKSSPTPPSQISSATLPKTTAQPLPGGLTFSANTSTKAAVIVETRYRQNLIPLMLHFMSVLGPTWPILFYTNEEQMPRFAASAALGRYIKSGHVEIRLLPKTVHFSNSNSVNRFMTDKWLWEDIPAENILMFQSDSILCANAVKSVEDFFDYDFVGAPIAKNRGVGYNGGLSLRKKSTTLRILNKWNWEQTQKVWFTHSVTHVVWRRTWLPYVPKDSLRITTPCDIVLDQH